ncbi:MAG: histidine phosphatase family protein [Gammaproteobacteria bacterium]|nr:histidine phosphatase family protein [Gammaproteobacteria bacterium]MBU2675905.1 histidine phosphatase family protein [Gammaproteobacteria bacterium]NNC56746.1 histidine phosphatase family protein [Woeseiaceae bacterium]NNL49641.1 histidine phosphatase family protein [Woeseiaceae bacterium]
MVDIPLKRRVAIDGANRRRLYLFRHGAVDYIDNNGEWVSDPDIVDLNERGRAQASGMAELFCGVHVDKALCTGLPRTRQTGQTILGDRDIELGVIAELEEIRPQKGETAGGYDIYSDIAFSHWRATEEDARFLHGERYHDFYVRVATAMEALLADHSWHNLAVFAHGGTNAAILGWATGVGLEAFGLLDQSMCCLNIIDFDTDDGGQVVRKTVRAMNITADDPVMRNRHSGDMEMLARRILKWQR